MESSVKRIVDGKTYNTDTSMKVARAEYSDDGWDNKTGGDYLVHTLYKTRGGAFFIHTAIKTLRQSLRTFEWEEVDRNEFEALTSKEAERWVMEGNDIELLAEDVFGEPPEAEEEVTPGATVYLRIPSSLKSQIDAAAADTGLSVNAWAMRCMETCITSRKTGTLANPHVVKAERS
jgi:predicted HicB family RNase H-like nuclease